MDIMKFLSSRAVSGLLIFLILLTGITWPSLYASPAFGQRVINTGPAQQVHKLHLRFPGEQPRPLSMVAGDFDEDGIGDLVIGYSLQKGGAIQLLRGNPDAFAPKAYQSGMAAGRHQFSDPYLQTARLVSTTTQPRLMISAELNGDGHLDLVYAARGNNRIYVRFGDGKGNFSPPASASVAGGLTALAAYRPGAPLLGEAILAAYQVNRGARLSILSYRSGSFSTSATYVLPAPATAMTVANLDADMVPDTAIVANGQLLILHGRNALSGKSAVTTVPVSGVTSVTAGQFLFDRHAQLQLSIVAVNGDVLTLAHQGFDPHPFTPQEISDTRRAQHEHSKSIRTLAQQAGNTGNEPWIEVERLAAVAMHAAIGRAPLMVRSRAARGFDDLVVIDSQEQQQTRISHTFVSPRTFSVASAAASNRTVSSRLSTGNVITAVSTRISSDTREGLVVLSADSVSPDIIVPSAGNTFYVNTTADNTGTATDPADNVRCTSGASEPCTLRDAITYANSDATDNLNTGASDTIMVPAGTYSLTWQAGTFDSNGNALTHLEILGPVSVVGSTPGAVIIDGKNNDVIFTINPGQFGSFNPSGGTYVFDLSMSNLTLRNGRNNNNPANSQGGFSNNVGGCINWDAAGSGNFTLMNVVIENCAALWGPGGGIWAYNSAGGGTGTLALSGGAIQNNSTPEQGGGLYTSLAPVAVSATKTVFSGNKADLNVNPNDTNTNDNGTGGGLFFSERQESPATPQTILTGVTVSSNVAAQNDGGGIFTSSGILISSSVIENNSAARWGGGLFSQVTLPETQTTVTSTDFLSNSAGEAGGAASGGTAAQSDGNVLQIGLSRIFGNTSTNGASGVAVGAPGEKSGQVIATENWWGCNEGPTTSGDKCDQALLYDPSTGSLAATPYAQLGFTADRTTIPSGGSMNLSVTMNTDSNGNSISGAFPAVAVNYPYTFNVTGITANPALATGTFNTAGVGNAILTPSTTGPGTISVTFDNQTDKINFTAASATTTSLSIAANPGLTYLYGQPSSFSVQLAPSNATGITASDFSVKLDGSSTGYSLTLISNNNYQISGPFNALAPGKHTLSVTFAGTTDFSSSSTSAGLTVNAGTVTLSDTVTPTNPVQGQGGTVKVRVAAVGIGAGPTGSITYAFNGGNSQSTTLSGGVANITIPTIIPTGGNSLSLSYSGDTNYVPASSSLPLTILGRSQTTITSLTATAAQINVFGFGFTAPSGQLAFNDVTSGNPVTGPVTLNTATATPSLSSQKTTSTGTFPVWTELADLNGDGNPDLITSIFGTDSVAVQLGHGDGTFGPATSILIAAGFGPAEVHAVSLRGNGTLDLIAGSFNTNQIAVLLGNGDGTFQTPAVYAVGTASNTPTSLTSGDFNDDGNLDVAVSNTEDNTVSVLIGNGTGTLTPMGTAIHVGNTPEAIRAGDFNDDGFSDLAVANYHDGAVSILLNNQDETFSANAITTGTGPQALAITGSGSNQLIAVANFGSNNVSILKNNGSGVFTAQTLVNVGKGPDEVRFIDINGDSIPDLIVANYTDGTLTLATGNAGGLYSIHGPFLIGTKPYSAAATDIDKTGTPDIVVANTFSNNTGVLLSGTQITVPYTGLSLPAGNTLNAAYSPDGSSKYGTSTSPNVVAP